MNKKNILNLNEPESQIMFDFIEEALKKKKEKTDFEIKLYNFVKCVEPEEINIFY